MRHASPILVGLVLSALGPVSGAAAQPATPPVIHRVTLQPDTGVLTIAGTSLGATLVVTVDGQAVDVLPGATAVQIEVLAPATVATMTGTFRLTVVDPVRQVGDAFVVASQIGRVAGGSPVPDPLAGSGSVSAASGAAAASTATPALGRAATVPRPTSGPAPNAVIEDPGAPFRTAIGTSALGNNTTGSFNTAAGFNALLLNTTGSYNTATGMQALRQNDGHYNTASGVNALGSNTVGNRNTATGFQSLLFNTTGVNNTATGNEALFSNTTGNSNTAVGDEALYSNTTASNNTAVGESALAFSTTGGLNTATGYQALYSNTSGSFNSAYGNWALRNTNGSLNVAVGYFAGLNATAGSHNVFLGGLVQGTVSDTNTMRLGLPYDGGTSLGQNRTFIAGIRGTAVSSAQVVFIDPAGQLGSAPLPPPAVNSINSAHVMDDALTASDLAPDAVGTSELADNAVTAAKAAFNYAASTSEGGPATDVACTGCVGATEVGFAFASLGANTFTGTQTLAAGHLDLAPSSAAAGNVTKGGVRFLHNTGTDNTFLGELAGNFAVTGIGNTAVGYGAGSSATTGAYNVFLGSNVVGTAADTNVIRIGLPFDGGTGVGQNRTFVAGIHGTPLTGPAVPVFVDANGQLGTLTAPIASGTGTVPPAALPPQLAEQQAINAAQEATIADLRARLARMEARLEALAATGARRR